MSDHELLPTTVHHVDIPTTEGVADGLLVAPEREGAWPGVLVFMDAFGVRGRLEEMASYLAAHGYAVLVPNLYYRDGRSPVVELPDLTDPDARGEVFGLLRPLMQSLTSERIEADAVSYLDFLTARSDVTDGPVLTLGYCMGVAHALRAAATAPDRVAAVAGFHGAGLATDDPSSPHLVLDRLDAAVLLGHADEDSHNPPEQQQRFAEAAHEARVDLTADVYAGARHGFTMADTAAYDEDATRRHWSELTDLLAATFHPGDPHPHS